jgi:hypothetical protein
VEEEKDTLPPLLLLCDHETFPVGIPYPDTVAVHVVLLLALRMEGEQDISIDVFICIIMICALLRLARLYSLPPYDPVILSIPLSFPVAVTLHDPEERVHVEEEKDTLPPLLLLCDHFTLPVGLLPNTIAVHLDE